MAMDVIRPDIGAVVKVLSVRKTCPFRITDGPIQYQLQPGLTGGPAISSDFFSRVRSLWAKALSRLPGSLLTPFGKRTFKKCSWRLNHRLVGLPSFSNNGNFSKRNSVIASIFFPLCSATADIVCVPLFKPDMFTKMRNVPSSGFTADL